MSCRQSKKQIRVEPTLGVVVRGADLEGDAIGHPGSYRIFARRFYRSRVGVVTMETRVRKVASAIRTVE